MGCNARQSSVPCTTFHDQQALREFIPRYVGLLQVLPGVPTQCPLTYRLIARDSIRNRRWTPQELPPSVLSGPDPFRRRSTPFAAVRPLLNLLRNSIDF